MAAPAPATVAPVKPTSADAESSPAATAAAAGGAGQQLPHAGNRNKSILMQELCNRSNLKSNSKGEDNSLKMASSNGGGGSDMTNNAKSGRDGAGVALPISASQSSSSSRSSSPSSTASPVGSQLPSFLLAAMTGSNNSNNSNNKMPCGPPSKKQKLNGELRNGTAESAKLSLNSNPEASNNNSDSMMKNPSNCTKSGKWGNEAATMTEPDSLGPCEPGTAVKLQGVVWQETDKGLLMLNVTWKGKTYMGTLLDCQRPSEDHKWGPPGDILSEKLKGKRGRNTRSRTPPVRIPLRKGQKQPKNNKQQQQQQERDLEEEAVKSNLGRTKQQFNMPVSPLAKDNGSNGGKFTGKRRVPVVNYDEDNEDSDENTNGDPDAMSPSSRLVECSRPACSKKFRDLDALKYHLSYAHNDLKKPNKPKPKSPAKAAKGLSPKKDPAADKLSGKVKDEPTTNGNAKPEDRKLSGGGSPKKEDGPLNFAKVKPASPAYSDISDEDGPSSGPPLRGGHLNVPTLPNMGPLAASLHQPPSVNHHHHKPGQLGPHGTTGGLFGHGILTPPPAHSSSHKKPSGLSGPGGPLSSHHHPHHNKADFKLGDPAGPHGISGMAGQFTRPSSAALAGFNPFLGPAAGSSAGLPPHLAAALASGRYPPGLFTPPGSAHLFPPASSATAKLQELQDRVMNGGGSKPKPANAALSSSSGGLVNTTLGQPPRHNPGPPPPAHPAHLAGRPGSSHPYGSLAAAAAAAAGQSQSPAAGQPNRPRSPPRIPSLPPPASSASASAAAAAAAAAAYTSLARDLLQPAHAANAAGLANRPPSLASLYPGLLPPRTLPHSFNPPK